MKTFLPVMLLCAPWLQGMFYHVMHTPMVSWMDVPPDWRVVVKTFYDLLGPDAIRYDFYQIVLILLIVLMVIDWRTHKNRQQVVLSALTLLIIFLPVAIFYVKSVLSQPAFADRHFLVMIPLAALLAGYLLARLLNIFGDRIKVIATCLMVIFIISISVLCNISKGLYSWPFSKEEYREVAGIVAKDKVFLSGTDRNAIVATNVFFQHYLNRFDVDKTPYFIFADIEQEQSVQALIQQNHVSEFYYLEHRSPRVYGKNIATDVTQALLREYEPLCRQQFLYAQAIKFRVVSSDKNITDKNLLAMFDNIPACRAN